MYLHIVLMVLLNLMIYEQIFKMIFLLLILNKKFFQLILIKNMNF